MSKKETFSKIGNMLLGLSAGIKDPASLMKINSINASDTGEMIQNAMMLRIMQSMNINTGNIHGKEINVDEQTKGEMNKQARRRLSQLSAPTDIMGSPIGDNFGISKVTSTGPTIENIGFEARKKQALAPIETAAKVQEQRALMPGELKKQELSEQQKIDIGIANEYSQRFAKSQADAKVLQPTYEAIFMDFNDALDEISGKIPEALESGIEGWASRQQLRIGSSEFFDEFPAVATLVDNLKADATAIAKGAGETRPTDEDIQRFVMTLLNPKKRSLKTNITKANSMVRRWRAKGINADWAEPLIAKMKSKLNIDSVKDLGYDPEEYEVVE